MLLIPLEDIKKEPVTPPQSPDPAPSEHMEMKKELDQNQLIKNVAQDVMLRILDQANQEPQPRVSLHRRNMSGASPALLATLGDQLAPAPHLWHCPHQCKDLFTSRGELNDHIRIKHNLKYLCVHCGVKYISKTGLQDHQKAKHPTDQA